MKAHLSAALMSGQMNHAYICEGLKGSGRHTTVRAFAAELLGTSLRVIEEGNHPDFKVIKPLPDKKTVSTDQVRRELVEDMMVKPYQASCKVYVVEDVQNVDKAAQNVMLKTLEEPPEYGMVFLLTDRLSALLPTIVSRSVRLRFQPLERTVLLRELIKRGLTPEAASLGAAFGQGSLGQAMEMCADEELLNLRKTLYRLFDETAEEKASGRIKKSSLLLGTAFLEKETAQKENVLTLIRQWYRDALVYQTTGDESRIENPDYMESIKICAEAYPEAQLIDILRVCQTVEEALKQNANYSVGLDLIWLAILA